MSHCGLQLVVTSSCVLVKMNLVVTSSCVLVKMKTVLCTLHQSLTVDEESLAARGAAEFLPGHSALSGSLSIIIIVVVGLLNSTEAPAGGGESTLSSLKVEMRDQVQIRSIQQRARLCARDLSKNPIPVQAQKRLLSRGRPREEGRGGGLRLREDPASFLQDVPVRVHCPPVNTQNQGRRFPGRRVKKTPIRH
ncbi:uncharacterized protein LOC118319324 isoform X4 [Scophthalmus maximus]|uniref:uncharacterized protein LOC118319324 isoform X4 n=1 Tax=Scophthalmus maximus TaxID=52904 RepID=UPI001FA847FD|nr:uncharacterized protein LOC118319324 isoform X4 [Scophthalmus maximus]